MTKLIFLVILVILLVGCAAQDFSQANLQPSYDKKAAVRDYCQPIREAVRYNVSNLYFMYGRWKDEGEISVTFTVSRNGKLKNSSINFEDTSIDNQILKNIALLGLEKSFPAKPFPKRLGPEHEQLKFNLSIHFKNEGPLKKKRLKPYQVGISICNINDAIREIYDLNLKKGIFVVNVYEDSPAFKAGLKAGDIIYSANDTKMNTTNQFVKYLRKHQGEIVLITNRGDFSIERELENK